MGVVPLATLWWPNLNPVGWISFAALGVSATMAVLASRWVIPAVQRVAVLGSPVILFVLLAALVELWGPPNVHFSYARFYARFLDASDFAAFIILTATGFGLGLSNLRRPGRVHRTAGYLCVLVFGCPIVYSFADWFQVATLFHFTGVAASLPSWPPFVAAAAFLLVCLVLLPVIETRARRRRRLAAGCCTRCGYDLRGSDGTSCPECGAMRTKKPPVSAGGSWVRRAGSRAAQGRTT